MTRIRDFLVLTACATTFTIIMGFSIFFGAKALTMSSLFIQHSLGQASAEDYLQILGECRHRDYQICSNLAAEKVHQKFPRHPMALAHMAIRYTQSKELDKAASFFAAYFSQAAGNAQMNYWYAQLLLAQGEKKKALRWSYLAVLEDPENQTYARALHELLVNLNKSSEALALIGFITKGRPQGYRYWSTEIARLERSTQDLEALMKEDISVPIRGEEAYVPVLEASNKRLRFFKVIDGNCVDCPDSMKLDKARVVSKLKHSFLEYSQ